MLSLIYLAQGHHEESIEALIQTLQYVDKLDVNMPTSRLKEERAKAEAVLAQHYAQVLNTMIRPKSGITRLGHT